MSHKCRAELHAYIHYDWSKFDDEYHQHMNPRPDTHGISGGGLWRKRHFKIDPKVEKTCHGSHRFSILFVTKFMWHELQLCLFDTDSDSVRSNIVQTDSLIHLKPKAQHLSEWKRDKTVRTPQRLLLIRPPCPLQRRWYYRALQAQRQWREVHTHTPKRLLARIFRFRPIIVQSCPVMLLLFSPCALVSPIFRDRLFRSM